MAAVKGAEAKPRNSDEVVAICRDLEATQRAQTDCKSVQFIVEGVVEYTNHIPGGVEQPDDRVGAFEARGVISRCRRYRHDIPGEQAADSDVIDIATPSGKGKIPPIRSRGATRSDLNRGCRHAVVR
jgi:hypothetical protein